MMTRSTFQFSEGAETSVPVAAGATMNAGFPVAVSRPMATGAELRALLPFEPFPISRLELVEVLGIVAIEAKTVAIVATMTHGQVFMLFGEDDFVVSIQLELHRLILFMAHITIESRSVPAGADQFGSREPDGRGVGKSWIDEWQR